MVYNEILISGFGGQGVMAIGLTLAEAGMSEGMNVAGSLLWTGDAGRDGECGVFIRTANFFTHCS